MSTETKEKVKAMGREGENEMRMCADCLGYGSIGGRACVYCKGAGRVITYRALVLRRERAERLANAAPDLYEALDKILQCFANGAIPHNDVVQQARAALALVDGPQTEKANYQAAGDKGNGI